MIYIYIYIYSYTAAKRSHPEAGLYYGQCLLEGLGGPVDEDAAEFWMQTRFERPEGED